MKQAPTRQAPKAKDSAAGAAASAPARSARRSPAHQAGNQALQRSLGSGGLRISQPGDASEVEARRTAELAPAEPLADRTTQPAPSAGSSSDGQSLDQNTRAVFETHFGHDLSQVQVHTGARASQAAETLGAQAFTVGQDIYFGAGRYQPGTSNGQKLLGHELAHTIQQQSASLQIARFPDPPGTVATDDPDWPFVPAPVEQPFMEDINLTSQSQRDFEIQVAREDPALFVVPVEASLEDVAFRLFGDETQGNTIDFVESRSSLLSSFVQPGRAVRLRDYSLLQADPYRVLREAMENQLRSDVDWTVSKLSERLIPEDEESELVQRALKWSQRSGIRDASGTQYFDRYLQALDAVTLVEWGLFNDESKSAYEWLIEEVPSRRELLVKAIELRSSRSAGYRVEDQRPEFARGDVVGRFFYSDPTHGDSIQIKVWETIANEESFRAAERATRNQKPEWMRVVVPGTGGRFYGYSVNLARRMPRSKNDMDWRKNPMQDPAGQFVWYYPGTLFIGPGEFRAEFTSGSEADREQRRSILTTALATATAEDLSPVIGLDFDVLSTASNDERLTLINLVLNGRGKGTEAGVALLARAILATPNESFPALERRMSTDGTLAKFFEVTKQFPALAVIGRAFTLKALQSIPIGVENLAGMESFTLGEDDDGVFHFAFSGRVRIRSRVVPAEEWQAGASPQPGAEPGLAGESGGEIERDAINFQRVEMRGGMWQLISDPEGTFRNVGTLTRAFLPTELVRIDVIGAAPRTMIVTALEAAGLLDLDFGTFLHGIVMPAANISLWAMAFGGLTRAFGPALVEGMLAGGVGGALRALAGQAATRAGAAALRSFAYEAALLSSMQVVDAYRDELNQSEAGRAFLGLYDVAMAMLLARDIHRVLSSGILGRLGRLGMDAWAVTSGATRAALRRSVDEIRALNLAWTRLREAGELVPAGEGMAGVFRPRDEAKLTQLWMEARGEIFSGSFISSLREAGHSTVTAERVFNRLQAISAKSAEMGSAQAALAQRAMKMTATDAENLLIAVERTLTAPRGLTTELSGWFNTAARASDPVAYLAQVDLLIARRGISAEAISVMGGKAARGKLDIFWLNTTSLNDRDLSFLGRDVRTPWEAYRAVATNPADVSSGIWARGSIRGASAELIARRNFSSILPDFNLRGSQVEMNGSILDYEVAESVLGKRHAFEVKGWRRDTWNEALSAYQSRTAGIALTEAESKAIRKLDNMITQLKNGKSHTGNHSLLGLTNDIAPADEAILKRLLRSEGLGDTRLVKLAEDRIMDMGRQLRAALGLP